VVLSAFSNKAAWLIKGKSGHAPSDRSRLQASGAAELFLMTLAPDGERPKGLLSRFRTLFDEKTEATDVPAEEVMRVLGW
jgi:hypothetical protein